MARTKTPVLHTVAFVVKGSQSALYLLDVFVLPCLWRSFAVSFWKLSTQMSPAALRNARTLALCDLIAMSRIVVSSLGYESLRSKTWLRPGELERRCSIVREGAKLTRSKGCTELAMLWSGEGEPTKLETRVWIAKRLVLLAAHSQPVLRDSSS